MVLKAINITATEDDFASFQLAASSNCMQAIKNLNATPLIIGVLMPEIAASFDSQRPFLLERGRTYENIVIEREHEELRATINSARSDVLPQSGEFVALEAEIKGLFPKLTGLEAHRTCWTLDFKYVPAGKVQRSDKKHVDSGRAQSLRVNPKSISPRRPVYMIIQDAAPDLRTHFWRDGDDFLFEAPAYSVIAYLGDTTFHNGRINPDPTGTPPRKRSFGRVVP